ncbi:hypothetical protein ACFFRR_006262 [Megaselia abdita]
MVSDMPICLRCFQFDHHRSQCKNHPVVSCSKCYGLNYLTRDCCNEEWKSEDNQYFQGFRLVGIKETRFFTDIPIGDTMVAGLIDTNRSTTSIDWAVFQKMYTGNRPLTSYSACELKILKKHPATIRCNIELLPGDLRIILGMDFITQRHVELFLGKFQLVPKLNGKYARNSEARFDVDVLFAKRAFTGNIDTSLTQSEIDVSILSHLRRSDPNYEYDCPNRVCSTAMVYKGEEIKLSFKVKRTRSTTLKLGTDFLKGFGFTMELDGIKLDINNPWKTEHQEIS